MGRAATPTATPIAVRVGPGRTISVRFPQGGNPPRLRAGLYTFVVTDLSSRDNFHLFGVERKTGISFIGTRRWTVTLRKGTYRYRSDGHPAALRGSFTVY
jgi:hypothetical protein